MLTPSSTPLLYGTLLYSTLASPNRGQRDMVLEKCLGPFSGCNLAREVG